MSITLHLGVNEVPYVEPDPKPRPRKTTRRRRRKGKAGTTTTYDVAKILEAKYHVMETFFTVREAEIGEMFAQGMAGALEDLFSGAPATNPFGGIEESVTDRFHRFLESEEMDGLAAGVPTQAALKGVSHRFKSKRGHGPRPSFIDTGLYEDNFQAWIEAR